MELSEEKKKTFFLLGLALVAILIVIYGFFMFKGGGNGGSQVTTIQIPKLSDQKDAYESDLKTDGYRFSVTDTSEINTLQQTTVTSIDDIDGIGGNEDSPEVDPYGQEDNEMVKEMERQIQELEQKRASLDQSPTTNASTTSAPPQAQQSKLSKEEKYLANLKRLKEARRAYEERKKRNVIISQGEAKAQEFLAVVYGDQYLLPGDRLELALPQDTKINGKSYVKGTPVFAYININKSRVILDINNIEGDRMSLTSEDAWDHREGIYSKKAGDLWRIYQNSQQQRASSEVAREASQKTGIPIVSSAITDLANFFRQKKIRKDQKILLVNNHKVILKTKL